MKPRPPELSLPSSLSAETVVVGAGAAGSVIASRMTESANQEVLLLEAGPDYPQPAELPKDLSDGRFNSMLRHDWGFRHRPTQLQVRFPLPRGKVVGGSSAVNTCIALRGQPADYEEWAALGLNEWGWDSCLPSFIRLEDDRDLDDSWHGKGGPLPIRRHTAQELAPWQSAFLEACTQLGYPKCEDSNKPGSTGAGPHAMNRIEGRRISAAEAWLTAPVRARENLRILSHAQVQRLLFKNRKLHGLEVELGGRTIDITASRVVLCGGAIGTLELLLRSGLGPQKELDRLGVEPIADIPGVGARLLDHPGVAFFLFPRWGKSSRDYPLIQTALRIGSGQSSVDPDILIQPGSSVPLPRIHLPLVSLMSVVGKPVGTGSIHWSSLKKGSKPVINSRFLEDDRDQAVALCGLKTALELAQTNVMRKVARPVYPSLSVLSDLNRLKQKLPKICDSGYHPCGTVPMGSEGDPMAATDGRGRLRGVTGVVIADASLMPTIPSANTHLATLMIGERFGEWLREGQI